MKMGEDPLSTSGKISFGIRKTETKLQTSSIKKEDTSIVSNIQFISSTEDLVPVDPSSSAQYNNLVIALIKRNKYSSSTVKPEQKPLNPDDAAAAAAILSDIKRFNGEETTNTDDIVEIPLWMQNRLPEGAEADIKADVELRADESSLDDYERIPVQHYGMAMLKGMGWKAEEGIGLKNKGVTKLMEVNVRPRGLGLGATPAKDKDKKKSVGENGEKEDEKEKLLKVHSYIRIRIGRYKDRVGKITSVDGDTDRFVILLVGEEKRSVSISGDSLELISQKEHDRAGRYINNDKYYDYKIVDEVVHMNQNFERRRKDTVDVMISSEENGRTRTERLEKTEHREKRRSRENGDGSRKRSRSGSREKRRRNR